MTTKRIFSGISLPMLWKNYGEPLEYHSDCVPVQLSSVAAFGNVFQFLNLALCDLCRSCETKRAVAVKRACSVEEIPLDITQHQKDPWRSKGVHKNQEQIQRHPCGNPLESTGSNRNPWESIEIHYR